MIETDIVQDPPEQTAFLHAILCQVGIPIRGWINHVDHTDSWGLRRHVLETLTIRPAEHRRAAATR